MGGGRGGGSCLLKSLVMVPLYLCSFFYVCLRFLTSPGFAILLDTSNIVKNLIFVV